MLTFCDSLSWGRGVFESLRKTRPLNHVGLNLHVKLQAVAATLCTVTTSFRVREEGGEN